MSELDRRIAQRRQELQAARRIALKGIGQQNEEMEQAYRAYLQEEEAVFGIRAADLKKTYPSSPPRFDLTADIAPLPVEVQAVAGRSPIESQSNGCCSSCGSPCSQKATLFSESCSN
jgi:hypothetical protein